MSKSDENSAKISIDENIDKINISTSPPATMEFNNGTVQVNIDPNIFVNQPLLVTNDPAKVSENSVILEIDDENENNEKLLSYYNVLCTLCQNNIEYFRNDETSKGQRLHGAFVGLVDHIETAKPLIVEINKFAHEFDFDEDTPGNGYRSFLYVTECCAKHGIKICRFIIENRNALLFRKGIYMKEIESVNHLLASLCTCLRLLLIIKSWCNPGELFPETEHTPEDLLKAGPPINQYCFYGRCLGFQFTDSIRPVLKFISICMAGFSEAYYASGGKLAKATSSMWTSGKYFMDPELRAKRIVSISQSAGIDFCKSFWFLAESEMMQKLPNIIGIQLKINKLIPIPCEPIIMRQLNGDEIMVPAASSHLPPSPTFGRLLSSVRREGMIGETKKTSQPISNKLIFHCHGGGFVAQSSKSHEVYLKGWAVKLGVPILSMDYSLAPGAPYPRALEEVFHAYCWAVNNCHLLGTTAEKIVLAGDSAGATLCLGISLKAIEYNIRKPDGVFVAYCPTLISFNPSPARCLSLMDPLLPFGFLMRCLKAYACPNDPATCEKIEKNLQSILNGSTPAPPLVKAHTINSKNSLRTISESEEVRVDEQAPKTTEVVQKIAMDLSPTSDKSDSFEEISVWEHIQASESDLQHLQAHKSPVSDATSDTLAGASFSQTGGIMDVSTPDEVNVGSLDDDSHANFPLIDEDVIDEPEADVYGPLTAAEMLDPLNSLEQEEQNALELVDQQDESSKYVSEFIERYVLDTKVDSDGNTHPVLRSISRTQSEENIIFDIGREAINVTNLQEKITKVAGDLASAVTTTLNTMTNSNPIGEQTSPLTIDQLNNTLNTLIVKSPSDDLLYHLPRDPFLSPYWADDETLKKMPPTTILTVFLDPCLDDCVMFAKKLKRNGVQTHLDIVEGLPHGFLNFSTMSKEAHQATKLCIKRIGELLELNVNDLNTPSGSTTSTTTVVGEAF